MSLLLFYSGPFLGINTATPVTGFHLKQLRSASAIPSSLDAKIVTFNEINHNMRDNQTDAIFSDLDRI